jgi:hypothetical protein
MGQLRSKTRADMAATAADMMRPYGERMLALRALEKEVGDHEARARMHLMWARARGVAVTIEQCRAAFQRA